MIVACMVSSSWGQVEAFSLLSPPLQTDAYGYHGGDLPSLDELPDEPRWGDDCALDHR